MASLKPAIRVRAAASNRRLWSRSGSLRQGTGPRTYLAVRVEHLLDRSRIVTRGKRRSAAGAEVDARSGRIATVVAELDRQPGADPSGLGLRLTGSHRAHLGWQGRAPAGQDLGRILIRHVVSFRLSSVEIVEAAGVESG
jgi:hypothetical protein